jgi:hypothetical protein
MNIVNGYGSNSTVPAWGVMAVTGFDTTKQCLTIAQPSTTFYRDYIVNGDLDVQDGTAGYAQNGPDVVALYNTAPSAGDGMGPTPSQWYLTKNYPQTAIVRGGIDTTLKTVECKWSSITNGIGKPNASISSRASGTVNVYSGAPGSESIISSMQITCFNSGAAVTTSDWVRWGYTNGALECFKVC